MSAPRRSREDRAKDAEHDDVIAEERREKHDEDEQADHLLHDEDLPDPRIEP